MRRKKAITLVCLLAVVGVMGTLTAFSVELYEVFCRVTGYGGTTQVADRPPGRVVERRVTVRFNADTMSSLAWQFEPAQDSLIVNPGQKALAFYRARSHAETTMVGTATFNVTPSKAGKYFNKIDCFCFTEQALDPGESADLPVQFYIDPAIVDDPKLNDVATITLSYTFFKAPGSSSSEDEFAAPRVPASTKANVVN